jgi:hypothetical protein
LTGDLAGLTHVLLDELHHDLFDRCIAQGDVANVGTTIRWSETRCGR